MTKLTYDDCKELKDAGFPQNHWKSEEALIAKRDLLNTQTIDGLVTALDNYTYTPTLSELIDACGEEFEGLFQVTHSNLDMLAKEVGIEGSPAFINKWYAKKKGDDDVKNFSRGSTPEQAVKNLWIALNKKAV